EVEQYSRQFGAWLLSDGGLQKGDRVAVQLPNLLQYPIAAWGILRAGLILVNTNPLYTERELQHQLSDSGAKALVTLADFLPAVQNVVPDTPVRTLIVTNAADMISPQPAPETRLGDDVNVVAFPQVLEQGEGKQLPTCNATMHDVAVLQYTGGTTGVAKGAMLTHGNIFTYTAQSDAVVRESTVSLDNPDILIAPLPIYHVFGLSLYLVGNFIRGGKAILIPNPSDLDGMMDIMVATPFTGFAAVNAMLVAMLQHPRFDDIDWSNNGRGTLTGGAALVPEVAREWVERTGTPIYEGYGLSETAASLTVNTEKDSQLGTVGKPLIGQQVKIVNSSGEEVGVGEEGELVVRGGQVMLGYWQRPEATEEAIDEQGFFHTGDVAVLQEDGFIKIVDRLKDMILVSGFNVYPNEIEAVVYEHPDIIEAAVVGKADSKSGEAVCLYAVSSNPQLSEDELRDFCRQNLTGYKIPRYVHFMDELPKSNVGKILRRELRD
ncbi:MAG: AMP-binding protein, partial [Arenicella sp.]|nr:AMP-binding protein [Arenicella sp.]